MAASFASRISPAVRNLLDLHRITIQSIKGSGRNGLVLKGDVLAFLKNPSAAAAVAAKAPSVSASSSVSAPSKPGLPPPSKFNDVQLTNMRKVIASRLTESKQNVPHAYVSVQVPVDTLLSLRKEIKERLGANVSVNDFIIKAAALALKQVPEANVSVIKKKGASGQPEDTVVQNPSIDISVAVATEGGLITPIVKNADKKGLSSISADIKDLADRARKNKLKPDEFIGGSFTISNLGMFGMDKFNAVINPPQACILAVGRSETQLRLPSSPLPSSDPFDDSHLTPASSSPINLASAENPLKPQLVTLMSLTLSYDRRGVEEDAAAKYMSALSSILSNPSLFLLS